MQMRRTVAAAIALIAAAVIALMHGAEAGDAEQATATIGAIERDLGSAHMHARQSYEHLDRAQMAFHWHGQMEQQKGAEMHRSGCAQPANPMVWSYCAALYRDIQEHVRHRQHLGQVIEATRASHLAAVRHIEELSRAGHWWKTKLAALHGAPNMVVAMQQ
jgi:hypothetical protein